MSPPRQRWAYPICLGRDTIEGYYTPDVGSNNVLISLPFLAKAEGPSNFAGATCANPSVTMTVIGTHRPLGPGGDYPSVPPHGPQEIEGIIRPFNRMRALLRRFNERSHAHDGGHVARSSDTTDAAAL